MTPHRTAAGVTQETSTQDLDRLLDEAVDAARVLERTTPAERAGVLRAVAGALREQTSALVTLAGEETGLPAARLEGEMRRTTGQLDLFADVLEEGSFLEATIDTARPDGVAGPQPDLRRMLRPVGPVLVFAASNFPFAFSVPGGDTASALAAGSPVVVKAHPGHPALSRAVVDVIRTALSARVVPAGAIGLVEGLDTGVRALQDPRIRAASFTGSEAGGRALLEIASGRPDPIPFYGELGSINPVFVTRGALAARADEIARGFVTSFTLGVGQFCTKPGLLLLPAGSGLEPLLWEVAEGVQAAPMLSPAISTRYTQSRDALSGSGGVRSLVDGPVYGTSAAPSLFVTTAAELLEDPDRVLQECFGPSSVVVEYDDEAELLACAQRIDGTLTATIHAQDEEHDRLRPLVERLERTAGRVIWNGWPTGVAVTWAMHHGGPFPATTGSVHTSVGTTAIRRFLHPVCYQDAPPVLLPDALQDQNVLGVPRRINGRLGDGDVPASVS